MMVFLMHQYNSVSSKFRKWKPEGGVRPQVPSSSSGCIIRTCWGTSRVYGDSPSVPWQLVAAVDREFWWASATCSVCSVNELRKPTYIHCILTSDTCTSNRFCLLWYELLLTVATAFACTSFRWMSGLFLPQFYFENVSTAYMPTRFACKFLQTKKIQNFKPSLCIHFAYTMHTLCLHTSHINVIGVRMLAMCIVVIPISMWGSGDFV